MMEEYNRAIYDLCQILSLLAQPMTYIHTDLADQIQHLKDTNKYAQALKLVNSILVSDPVNTDALMHIADINYRQ